MKIPIYVNVDGQIRPNVTQDVIENAYRPQYKVHKIYHGRQGASSNLHHHSTQARLHQKGKDGLGHIVTGSEQTGELPNPVVFLQEQDFGFS